jgi:hypothetical protein
MAYSIKNNIEVIAPVVYTKHYGLLEYGIMALVIGTLVVQLLMLIREIKLWEQKRER